MVSESRRNETAESRLALDLTVIAAVRITFYINTQIGIYPDSGSYINWSYEEGARTPGYPFIIDIFQFIMGERYAAGLCFLQAAVSFLSLLCLYQTVRMLLYHYKKNSNSEKSKLKCQRLAELTLAVYGCCPAVFLWDMVILTESFAISFTVFFIYTAIKWLGSMKLSDGILMILTAWACTMIKASLIIYSADILILVFLVFVMCKKCRKQILQCGCFLIPLMLFYTVYIIGIYHYTGVLNITEQKPRHDLVKVMESGLYKNYSDKELVNKIERIYAEHEWGIGYATTSPVMALFGSDWKERRQAVASFNKACLKTDFSGFVKYMIQAAADTMEFYFDGYRVLEIRVPCAYNILEKIINSLFKTMTVGHVFLIGGLLFIEMIRIWITSRECPFILAGISGGIFSILISVYLGTYAEFTRALSCVLPFAYIGAAVLTGRFLVFPEYQNKTQITKEGLQNENDKED